MSLLSQWAELNIQWLLLSTNRMWDENPQATLAYLKQSRIHPEADLIVSTIEEKLGKNENCTEELNMFCGYCTMGLIYTAMDWPAKQLRKEIQKLEAKLRKHFP